MLGITEEYTAFDDVLIMHINSVFMILTQLGVGPSNGFTIKDDSDAWNDFVSDETKLELVKSYVYLKVKLLFDTFNVYCSLQTEVFLPLRFMQ